MTARSPGTSTRKDAPRAVGPDLPRTQGQARSSTLQVSFTPVDNQRLANLCGALDENLRAIERILSVNALEVLGEKP